MLISHVPLYIQLSVFTLTHLIILIVSPVSTSSVSSNWTNYPLIVSPVASLTAATLNHQVISGRSSYDSLLEDESIDQEESLNYPSYSGNHGSNEDDTSVSTWTRLSSSVGRAFSPPRLSSRLNSG